MKAHIIKTNDGPRSVISSTIRGSGLEIIRALGCFTLITRNLQAFRLNHLNPKPYTNITLKLSQNLKRTHESLPLYRYGPEQFGNLLRDENIFFPIMQFLSFPKILFGRLMTPLVT